MFFACLTVVGQVNQVWWSKGRVLHVNPVAGIDSVTYGQFVDADTFLIVIDRASRRIVYDTVDVHVPGMVFHDTIRTTHTVYLEPSSRIGVFSVAKDKQVSFSQGNLQYIQNQNIWKFADQQYEYIGARNIKDGKLANKIDLFGWSGDNTTAPFGVSTSTNAADYAGDFVDWGVNEISGDAPNTWRTLSKDEWEYLFEKRKNAQKLYGVAQVNGSNGIIILPDNWSFDNGISFKTGLHSVETDDYSIFQSFTDQEFSVLESFGAVFIHASGWREGISIEKTQRSGYYWSSTPYNNTDAYRMTFYSYYLKPCDIHYKYRGRSVRLVHDTIVPPPAPEYVDLGLSVKWATFNVGASVPEDYGDYFAWGEVEPKDEYSWENYKWCDGTESVMTKYNDVDNKSILDEEDDAAKVNWGGEWRMPTDEELTELREKCTWEWTMHNGVNGYKVIGVNENSIFLPATGYYLNILKGCNVEGCYWTKSKTFNKYSCGLYLSSGVQEIRNSSRLRGHTIRPVYDEPKPSKRIGVFSVAKDKQVSFSQGNLQYVRNQDVWKFADQQYEYIGADNVKDGKLANKIDLFGWSGDNTTAPFGVSTSTNAADYSGDFVDWGVNEINGEAPNTWRTLTKDEWEYLITERENASLLYGVANVASVNGLIILPDTWVLPEGLTFQSGFANGDGDLYFKQYQIFTEQQWLLLETAGAIFLPAAGIIMSPNTIVAPNLGAHYQSSTRLGNDSNYWFGFRSSYYTIQSQEGCVLRSVRLVHDTILPPPAPCETFEVNGVKFNMMCVEGGTFMMGAADDEVNVDADEKPQHQVTVSDYMIGQTEVTQELWTAVMGSNPSKTKGDKLPVEQISWAECQEFISKLNKLTGLYFRLPTEAEWEFAARGGNRSRGFVYAGSDDIDEVAWTPENSENKTHNVGEKKPNELGIYDMSGNVYERCSDWYASYSAEPQINPQGPSSSTTYRVSRGGCAMKQNVSNEHFGAYYCRILNRGYGRLTTKSSIVGLRLVLDTHQYVDLGLSVMWATTNVGATAPEEYGDYFAWGEVKSKDVYSWETYKWCDGTKSGITKYNAEDGLTTLLPEDDVAYVNWGGEWRMPTKNELTELRERCTWEWTIVNGVNGCRVTGPNGNSIFLPAAGSYNSFDDQLNSVGSIGWLFSSDRASNLSVHELGFSSTGAYQTNCSRCVGLTIRPVIPTDRKYIPEYVDMGLSVKWASCNLGASVPNGVGDFYAWGETTPKDSYTVKNYKWCNGSANAITKYCTVDTLGNNGFTDGLTTLQLGDDAAYMQKGGKWRMPTDEEWDELRTQCTWTLTEKQGMSGYEVTSKINGNTIFIPVAGFRSGENIVLDYIGAYWSSSLNESKQTCALGLYINKNENRVGRYSNSNRCNGFLIRPVNDENKVTVTVNATPSTSKIGFLCIGYTRVGNTITVDKGKSVLYSVTNLEERYLSQGDSLLNLTKDTTLNVTLEPFSEGHWVTLDTSKFEHVVDYYISRNSGAVAGKYVGWSYYILPVEEGETYRVTTKGGQLAAPWLVVSSLPDPETKIRATKVACSDIKGPVSVVSEEFTIPSGGGNG